MRVRVRVRVRMKVEMEVIQSEWKCRVELGRGWT